MSSYENRLERARQAFSEADGIVIGGGAGLSDAAGIRYSGGRFEKYFGEFIHKYGFSDLYSSSFYNFRTQKEKWVYWAKHIYVNRYLEKATSLYIQLRKLVCLKSYYIITTNVDAQFFKAGFPSKKIFAAQGDYGLMQCATGCHDTLYDNRPIIMEIVAQTKDFSIPEHLIPKCPVCGGEMDVHLHSNMNFICNKDWYNSSKSYSRFINHFYNSKLLLIELGVGLMTPSIIRLPFEKILIDNPKSRLIRINRDYPYGFKTTRKQTISFAENIKRVIQDLQ